MVLVGHHMCVVRAVSCVSMSFCFLSSMALIQSEAALSKSGGLMSYLTILSNLSSGQATVCFEIVLLAARYLSYHGFEYSFERYAQYQRSIFPVSKRCVSNHQ